MGRRLLVIVLVVTVLLLLVAPLAEAASPRAASGVWHVVRWGETLFRIARHDGVTVSAIVAANNIANPNRIWPGQRLFIPTGAPAAALGCEYQLYTVRWRDTLSSISRQFGVTVWSIVQANHLVNPNVIYAGQTLTIPRSSHRIDAPVSEAVLDGYVRVSGWGSGAFENTVPVDVRTAEGVVLARASAIINASDMGGAGSFAVDLHWTRPASTQPGRVVVFEASPKDGRPIDQTCVQVTIQGG